MSDPELSSEDRKRLKKIKEDPAKFCKHVLRLEPFPYQQKFLEDKSNRIVVCAGRQVGKSLMTSARAIWFALAHDETTTLIVSATLRQSLLMFSKIVDFVHRVNLLKESLDDESRTFVRFKTGSAIHALPCGRYGNSLRGYTANMIIIDEAAFVPEEVILEVAMPMLSTTSGTMILLSTPYDKKHFFHRAFTSPVWSKYQFKSSDNPRITSEFLDEQREELGETRYRQEYLAEFVDDDTTFFPQHILSECVHACQVKENCPYCAIIYGGAKPLGGDLYAGFDPGGFRDPAALVVVQRGFEEHPLTKERRVVFKVVLSRTFIATDSERKMRTSGDSVMNENQEGGAYTRFSAQVSDIHREWNFRRMLVDSTGMGSPIVEHLRSLKVPVEGFNLSSKSKTEILSNLKILLEQRRVVLPDDLTLLSNLNCIEAGRTMSGGYEFHHPQNTHDDLAYALALAAWAARTPGRVIMMRPPGNERKDDLYYSRDNHSSRYS